MKKYILLLALASPLAHPNEIVYRDNAITAHRVCIAGFYWILFKSGGNLIHATQMYDIVKGSLASVPMPIRCGVNN